MELQCGDRVRVKSTFAGTDMAGMVGTVIALPSKRYGQMYFGVQFDEKFLGGHDCSGTEPNYPRFKKGHCRWGSRNELEFIEHGDPISPVSYGNYMEN